MPAAVVFGRRWKVGTDDLVFPALLDFCVKSGWLIAAIYVYIKNEDTFEISDGYYFRIYLCGLISTLVVLLLTDALVVKNSMNGGILEEGARIRVVPFVYIRLFFEVVDICWNVLGSVWSFGNILDVTGLEETLSFMKRFTICNWISLVVLILLAFYLYDPLGTTDFTGEAILYRNIDQCLPFTSRSQQWEKQCKSSTCFCLRRRKEDDQAIREGFQEASKILAFLFRDDQVHLVSTDVVAALVALYVHKELPRRELEAKLESSAIAQAAVTCVCKNNVLFPITAQPRMSLNGIGSVIINNETPCAELLHASDEILLLDHYLGFIQGCYGWEPFLVNNFKKGGMARLWSTVECCSCFRTEEENQSLTIEGDNCCFCHTSALKQSATKILPKDIFYASFRNDMYEPPFYVAVNHKTRSIVVAIRGALSVKDVMSAVTAWPVNIDTPGVPSSIKAHHGMLIAAQNVKKKLDTKNMLPYLLGKYPNYNITLLGQSTGGGIATLLGFLLYSQYPKLKVYAYSPPGCLLNADGAKFAKAFTISVTYGEDIIARMNLESLEKFKSQVFKTLKQCKTPKYRLLLNFWCLFGKTLPLIEMEREPGDSRLNETTSQARHGFKRKPIHRYPQMYMGGQILHIKELKKWEKSPLGPRWRLEWVDKSNFKEIVINPRMFADHWHHRMEKALQEFVISNCKDAFIELNHSRTEDILCV